MTKGDRVALHDLRTFSVLDNIDAKDFKSKKESSEYQKWSTETNEHAKSIFHV